MPCSAFLTVGDRLTASPATDLIGRTLMRLHSNPPWDDLWVGSELASHGGERYIAVNMLYNVRLIVVEGTSATYRHGWCYPKGAASITRALAAFDPNIHDEPEGWHKRAAEPRRAPQRHLAPHLNGPRCLHGARVNETPCTVEAECNRRARQAPGAPASCAAPGSGSA